MQITLPPLTVGTCVRVGMGAATGFCIANWVCHIALIVFGDVFVDPKAVASAIVLESPSCLIFIGRSNGNLAAHSFFLHFLIYSGFGVVLGGLLGYLGGIVPLGRSRLLPLAIGVVWSLIMTAGTFAFLNDFLVAARENGESERGKDRYTIRDAFLRDISRTSIPATLIPQEVDDFVGNRSHYGLIIADSVKAGESKADSDKVDVDAFKKLLEKSDATLKSELGAKLERNALVVAKTGNTAFGYSEPVRSAVTWGDTAPSIRSQTSESIRRGVLGAWSTAPNDLQVAQASTLADLLAADLNEIEDSMWVSLARRSNGIVQFLGLLPFFFGVWLVAFRLADRTEAPQERLEELSSKNPILSSTGGESSIGTVAARAIKRILESDTSAANDDGRSLVDRLVLNTLRAFLANGDPRDAAQSVESYREHSLNRMYSEHGLLRFVVWVIPLVGFMGTLIGIGSGLIKANALVDPDVDPATALQGVVSELGLAFDITALMASMVLMFAFYLLQRREEETILKITDRVSHDIVRRLERRGWSFEKIQLRFSMTKDQNGRFQKDYDNGPMEYSVRILEIFGRDPHLGYVQADPARMIVRLSNVGLNGVLPAQGVPLDLELGAKHFTEAGLYTFVMMYFGGDTTPKDLVPALRSWCAVYPDSTRFQQLEAELAKRGT